MQDLLVRLFYPHAGRERPPGAGRRDGADDLAMRARIPRGRRQRCVARARGRGDLMVGKNDSLRSNSRLQQSSRRRSPGGKAPRGVTARDVHRVRRGYFALQLHVVGAAFFALYKAPDGRHNKANSILQTTINSLQHTHAHQHTALLPSAAEILKTGAPLFPSSPLPARTA